MYTFDVDGTLIIHNYFSMKKKNLYTNNTLGCKTIFDYKNVSHNVKETLHLRNAFNFLKMRGSVCTVYIMASTSTRTARYS